MLTSTSTSSIRQASSVKHRGGAVKDKQGLAGAQEGEAMDGEEADLCVKKGSSDVTMSSSDWGPCVKASHQSIAVDQRAVACTALPMIFCRGRS